MMNLNFLVTETLWTSSGKVRMDKECLIIRIFVALQNFSYCGLENHESNQLVACNYKVDF